MSESKKMIDTSDNSIPSVEKKFSERELNADTTFDVQCLPSYLSQ